MRRRIYISGPITGTTDYKQRFEETEKKLKETFPDADIVNPVKITESLEHFTHDEYLKVCIAALSSCNMIFLMRGWEKSEGVKEELRYVQDHVERYVVVRDPFIVSSCLATTGSRR